MCTGRRFGKTFCLAGELLDWGRRQGGEYGWVAPTYNVADRGIEAFRDIGAGFLHVGGRAPARIEFQAPRVPPTKIWFLSADNPDSIRGFGFQGLVIDEAASIPQDVWHYVLRPTISQTLGWAVFVSTPKGRNWFYDLFTRGQDPTESDYASFTFPSKASPFFPAKEWEEAKRTLPEDVFRQEYMAEFMEDSAGVFRGVDACLIEECNLKIEDSPRQVVIGCDIAKHTDWTVLIGMDVASGRCLAMERFNQLDWPIQKERIVTFARKWRGRVILDATGIGDPIYDDLKRVLPDIEPFKLTVGSKTELVQRLIVALEQRQVCWPGGDSTARDAKVREGGEMIGNVSRRGAEAQSLDVLENVGWTDAARAASLAVRRAKAALRQALHPQAQGGGSGSGGPVKVDQMSPADQEAYRADVAEFNQSASEDISGGSAGDTPQGSTDSRSGDMEGVFQEKGLDGMTTDQVIQFKDQLRDKLETGTEPLTPAEEGFLDAVSEKSVQDARKDSKQYTAAQAQAMQTRIDQKRQRGDNLSKEEQDFLKMSDPQNDGIDRENSGDPIVQWQMHRQQQKQRIQRETGMDANAAEAKAEDIQTRLDAGDAVSADERAFMDKMHRVIVQNRGHFYGDDAPYIEALVNTGWTDQARVAALAVRRSKSVVRAAGPMQTQGRRPRCRNRARHKRRWMAGSTWAGARALTRPRGGTGTSRRRL